MLRRWRQPSSPKTPLKHSFISFTTVRHVNGKMSARSNHTGSKSGGVRTRFRCQEYVRRTRPADNHLERRETRNATGHPKCRGSAHHGGRIRTRSSVPRLPPCAASTGSLRPKCRVARRCGGVGHQTLVAADLIRVAFQSLEPVAIAVVVGLR